MIPITRKELYLNKIVGNNDYETPEKPITTEEFFFAEILGEAVQAPEPLTRYQMYLAKIAGRDIEIPYPETRLEYFLARAAGMDIETPTPITREEIFWSNYTAIVEFEVEGVPPLTYKAIEGTLKNYRIYGNTSKNILPLSKTPKTETIGDILCEYDGKGTFTFTSNVDNPTYTQDQWFWVPFEEDFDFPVGISDGGRGCIQLNNDFATEYGVNPYFVAFANRDNGEFVSGFGIASTRLNNIDYNYDVEDLEGLPANCIVFQQLQSIGKRTVTIKPALYLDIITQQPFEPYGESVGDLVTSGEHAGEYKVPVIIEGKNLLQNIATSLTSRGVTFTVNADGSVTCNGTASNDNNAYLILARTPNFGAGTCILTGCPDGGSVDTYSIQYSNNVNKAFTEIGSGINIYQFSNEMYPGSEVRIRIASGYTCDNLTFYPMIRKADIEDDTYELYRTPVTTLIYLPEPIKMVGDEPEYIDYGEQKQHRVRANYLQSSDFEGGAIYTGKTFKNNTYQESKTPPGLFDFDSTRKRSTKLITISGTYTISIADGWEFGIVMFPNDRNSGDLFIYNTEPVTISNCTFAIQIKKSDLSDISSADISDYKIMLNEGSEPLPYEPYIVNTDLDVTLPALPTVTGTNVLSVGTEVQPSKVYIKGQKEREYG